MSQTAQIIQASQPSHAPVDVQATQPSHAPVIDAIESESRADAPFLVNPQYLEMAEGGFNTTQIASHYKNLAKDTGFSDQEVNGWINTQQDFLYYHNLGRMDKGQAPIGAPPRDVGVVEAAKAGFAESNTGLRLRLGGADFGELPDAEDRAAMPFYKKFISDAFGIAGDLPDMSWGAMLGMAVTTTAASLSGPFAPAVGAAGAGLLVATGAFGAASGVKEVLQQQLQERLKSQSAGEQRKSLMEALEGGDTEAFSMIGDSLKNLWSVAHKTTEGMAVGAAAHAGGMAGRVLGESVGLTVGSRALVQSAATGTLTEATAKAALGAPARYAGVGHFGGEILGLVGGQGIVEGRVPEFEDFEYAAMLILGLRAVSMAPGTARRAYNSAYPELLPKLRKIFEKTGETPLDVAEAASKDASIVGDLLSSGRDIPRVYQESVPVETVTLQERGVTALPSASVKVLQSAEWNAAKGGDISAARSIVDGLMTDAKIGEALVQAGDGPVVFVTVPSTTRRNMLPVALAEKLAETSGGKAVNTQPFVSKEAQIPMKDVPVADRPFAENSHAFNDAQGLKDSVGNAKVIVVEDVLTTGASAHAFIRALRENGIEVQSVVGLMGDARLTAEPQIVSKLQHALKNSGIEVNARELASVLSRGEVQAIIKNIRDIKGLEGRNELAARIQGILDDRTLGRVREDTGGQGGPRAQGQVQGNESPDAGIRPSPGGVEGTGRSGAGQGPDSGIAGTPEPGTGSSGPAVNTAGGVNTGTHHSQGRFDLPTLARGSDGAPVSLSDTISSLSQALQVPVRTGKMGVVGRAVAGIYKERGEVIRTRIANDITTIAHEFGHHFEKTLSGAVDGKSFDKFAHELDAIATIPRPGGSITSEGFAEFLRYYITDPPAAKATAPTFFDHFESDMAAKAHKEFSAIKAAQEQVQGYLKQPAVSEILSHISFGDKEPGLISKFWKLNSDKEARADAFASLRNEAVRQIVDRFDPLRRVTEELAQGRDLLLKDDPYKLARVFQGVAGKANAFLEYAPFHYNTLESVQGVRSLKDILKDVQKDGGSLEQFSAYLVSNRAVELSNRGIRPGPRLGTAREVVAELGPKYEALGKELVAYQDSLVQYLVDAGVMDGAAAAKMRSLNQNYVPFQRVIKEYELFAQRDVGGGGTGKGFGAFNPIKRIKGSGRDIVDPLESILANTYTMIEMAEKNGVGRALIELARQGEGMGWLIEEIPNPKQATQISARQVINSIKDVEPALFDALKDFAGDVDGMITLFTPSTFIDKKSQITVLEGGKRKVFQVAPEIAEVMNNLGTAEMGAVLKWLGAPARTLRAGAVLSPDFAIRNTIRDMMEAAVKSDSGFIPVIDSARGIASGFQKDAKYWDWAKAGGDMASLVHMDRQKLSKTLKDFEEANIRDKVWNVVSSPIEQLRLLTELSEAGTRLGEFGKSVDKLLAQGLSRPDALRQAALNSRDVSIDFARAGVLMRVINQLIPFSNAKVQSFWRLYEVAKERPREAMLKAAIYITVPSIMLAIYNGGDEDIKELPAWQRDMYWCFKVPGGNNIWRIPKPFELGVLLGSVPERAVTFALDVAANRYGSAEKAREEAFRGLGGTLWDSAILRFTPTAIAPFVSAYANKSLFTDRPIVPADREGMLPEYRYTPYTTQFMRGLSSMLGGIVGDSNTISPAMGEQIVRDWTGGLGMYALQFADFALRKAGALPDPTRPADTLADIPVIRAFVARNPSMSAESIKIFGDNYRESQVYLNTIKGLVKEFRAEDIEKYIPWTAYKSLQGTQETLQGLRTLQRIVYNSPEGSPDEKRQQLEALTWRAIQAAAAGNKAFDAIRDELKRTAGQVGNGRRPELPKVQMQE